MVIYLIQVSVVAFQFQTRGRSFFKNYLVQFVREPMQTLTFGLGVGLGLFVLSLPLAFLPRMENTGIVPYLSSHLLGLPGIGLACVALIVTPAISEFVFCEIIFKGLDRWLGQGVAFTLTVVLFALTWPLSNAISSGILGLTSLFVFRTRKHIKIPVLANVVFTACWTFFLIWRYVQHGRLLHGLQ